MIFLPGKERKIKSKHRFPHSTCPKPETLLSEITLMPPATIKILSVQLNLWIIGISEKLCPNYQKCIGRDKRSHLSFKNKEHCLLPFIVLTVCLYQAKSVLRKHSYESRVMFLPCIFSSLKRKFIEHLWCNALDTVTFPTYLKKVLFRCNHRTELWPTKKIILLIL